MSSKVRETILVLLLAVAVVGSTVAVVGKNGYEFFDPMIDVKAMLDRLYVTEPDDGALQTAAINGMIEALDDPHTMYIPPEVSEDFAKGLSGEYVGIGAEVILQDGWLTIVNPMDDSPALAAGLRPDDRVLAIDGEPTKGKPIDDSIDMLKGEPGTTATLTVQRGDTQSEIVVTRAHIKTREVLGFHRAGGAEGAWNYLIDGGNGIAYVRVAQFTSQCAEQTRAALEEAKAAAGGELHGVILDLRDNPGGMLDEAVEMADLFIADGTIVSTRGLHHPETVFEAEAGGPFESVPMMVLVNGLSASASEVVSGALKDSGRALVVGSRSFGKGSVQTVRSVPSLEGAALKITEQFYYLPSGRCLHRVAGSAVWGVDPSPGYFIALDDEQQFEMRRARREQEIRRFGDEPEDTQWSDPDWIVQTLHDPQLGRALTAMQARAESGAWPAVDESEPVAHEAEYLELSRLETQITRMMREVGRVSERIADLRTGSGIEESTLPDLIPDGATLTGGSLVITGADGREVARLKITGEDLERWLIDADVAPAGAGSQ
jgi:carboxyl-terminal processing protease